MWVRGLKHVTSHALLHQFLVAPYVGAWIETYVYLSCCAIDGSHPMWVRGLKHPSKCLIVRLNLVAPYVGAWIETRTQFVLKS